MYQVTRDELRKSLRNYLTVYSPAGLRLTTESDREQLLDGIIRTVLGKSGRLLFPDKGQVPDNLSGGFILADIGWSEAGPDPAAGIPSRDDDMAQMRYRRARKIAAAQAAKGGMTPTEERLAEALAIRRMYGDRAPVWVAERIGKLALAGDAAGVQRFKEIATQLDALMRAH